MQRVPEPELMDEAEQARAYAQADFEEPHSRFLELFRQTFPAVHGGRVLDLGCGPGDITLRFARAFPDCIVHGVDGAANMLRFGLEASVREGLQQRVHFVHGYLPGARLPLPQYDVLISNSLLHHLADPGVLWRTIDGHARTGAAVFVVDLLRPDTADQAGALVERYAGGEPEVLRRDFYHSLLAAYRPDEIELQLRQAAMGHLSVAVVSDRHVMIAGYR